MVAISASVLPRPALTDPTLYLIDFNFITALSKLTFVLYPRMTVLIDGLASNVVEKSELMADTVKEGGLKLRLIVSPVAFDFGAF